VDAATGPDVVYVCAGTYTLAATVIVDVNITVVGEGAGVTTISGDGLVRIFDIQAPATTFALQDLTLIDGTTGPTGKGGAVQAAGAGMSVTATDVSFETNRAYGGGAIFADGDVTIDGGRLVYNGSSATLYGGAIYSQGGHVSITDATVGYNRATQPNSAGGAVQADSITITGSRVGYNEAGEKGGALSASTVTISRSSFGYNSLATASSLGGAVWSTSTDASDSSFGYNSAAGGGALASSGGITLHRNVFGYNTASLYGGAAYSTGSVIQADNNTLVGNTADGAGGGLMAGASIALANNTFTGNVAPVGRSVLSATLSTSGSIFADEGGGSCQVTNPQSGSGNLTLDDTCTGQLTTLAELALQPPTENGGPTQTIALGSESVAIDFDTTCLVAVDQRGYPRPFGEACDAGAYEFQPAPVQDPSQIPPAWLKATGRESQESTCPNGWAPSWAEWPGEGRGGFTCESSVVYDTTTATWLDKVGFTLS
jgi:predicted outer membrane repeat protein/parallel beta-helix repeat protein